MTAPTHALAGITLFKIFSVLTGIPFNAATIAFAALGALTPDIDCPMSWLGRRTLPFSLLLGWFVGHRGVTHSLFLLGSLTAVGVFLIPFCYLAYVLAFLFGFLSHLVADWLTNSGIPLFWPSEMRFRALWTINTGSLAERCLTLCLFALVGYLGWQHLGFPSADRIPGEVAQCLRSFVEGLMSFF